MDFWQFKSAASSLSQCTNSSNAHVGDSTNVFTWHAREFQPVPTNNLENSEGPPSSISGTNLHQSCSVSFIGYKDQRSSQVWNRYSSDKESLLERNWFLRVLPPSFKTSSRIGKGSLKYSSNRDQCSSRLVSHLRQKQKASFDPVTSDNGKGRLNRPSKAVSCAQQSLVHAVGDSDNLDNGI